MSTEPKWSTMSADELLDLAQERYWYTDEPKETMALLAAAQVQATHSLEITLENYLRHVAEYAINNG